MPELSRCGCGAMRSPALRSLSCLSKGWHANAARVWWRQWGRLSLNPNAANVIPASVTFTIDLRTTSDETRHAVAEQFRAEARAVAERRDLGLAITQTRDTPTTLCDPRLQEGFTRAVEAVGFTPPRLSSGAGHDGQAMVKLCPVGMLFVRCRGGISHNPAEYASPPGHGSRGRGTGKFHRKFQSGRIRGLAEPPQRIGVS